MGGSGGRCTDPGDSGDQGHGGDDHDDSSDDRHHAAIECSADVLRRRHGHDDGDVDARPEHDATFGRSRQQLLATQPACGHEEQDHGESNATDVGVDAGDFAQQCADDLSHQHTYGEDGCAVNNHVVSEYCRDVDHPGRGL